MRIVERRAKSGIYLTTRQASVEAMALFAKAGVPLDPIQIYEAVELRKIHEIKAAELACCARDRGELRAAARNPEGLRRSGSPRASRSRARTAISIWRSCAPPRTALFHSICSVYYVMGEDRLPIYFSDPERSRRSHAEHLQIFDALLRRDGNLAQALMSAHLQGAESYWKGPHRRLRPTRLPPRRSKRPRRLAVIYSTHGLHPRAARHAGRGRRAAGSPPRWTPSTLASEGREADDRHRARAAAAAPVRATRRSCARRSGMAPAST